MAILIYPSSPKPAYGVTTTQKHRTLISGTQSGGELRRRSIRFPKRNVGLLYNYLSLSNRNIIQNFFKDRDGSYEEFWYVDYKSKHWHDEYVGRGGPLNLIGAIQDDGGTFTSDTVACIKFITDGITPNEMHLLPAAPAHDDAYYFGAGSPFDLLTITIGTAGTPAYDPGVAGWTLTWEYWNGTTWHAFAGGEFTDDTLGFTAAAGARDFHIVTMPTDWAITSIYDINAYWIRARVELFVTCTVRPLGSGAVVNSKYYDLHGVTTSEVSVYVDGVLKTAGGTDYTFVSGGGAAGSDRIVFVNYPAVGSLITSDFSGFLRIKSRFSDDELGETDDTLDLISLKTSISEIQW